MSKLHFLARPGTSRPRRRALVVVVVVAAAAGAAARQAGVVAVAFLDPAVPTRARAERLDPAVLRQTRALLPAVAVVSVAVHRAGLREA
jgi:hypothetical protein